MKRLVPFLAISIAVHLVALFSLFHGVRIPKPARLWTAEVLLSALPQPESERLQPANVPAAPKSPTAPQDRPRPRAKHKTEAPPEPRALPAPTEAEAQGVKQESSAPEAAAPPLPDAGEGPPAPLQAARLGPGAATQAAQPDFDPTAVDRFWAEVRNRIAKNQTYPLWARRNNIEGVVVVRFSLTREGRVQKVELEKSSGHSVLDEAAVQAVLQGDPYPPAPEGVSSAQLVGKVPIRFSLQSGP